MFGPFIIKQRRNEVKRYGAIFSCIENRSVHIDIGRSQDKNSFIQAIRRVIAYWENMKTLYSDNGSNFVDNENEPKKE